jgi:flagellar motor switch protein FliN/FliY
MNAAAATILAESFLKGFFDVFDAILSQTVTCSQAPPTPADEAAIKEHLAAFPVQLSAVLQRGLGQISVLLPVAQASQMAMAAGGAPAGDGEALSEAEKTALREIADPALGGGVARAMELCAQGVVQLEDVLIDDTANASVLTSRLGGSAIAVPFHFEAAEGLTGDGIALFSFGMDTLVPPGALQPAVSTVSQATLSPDELNDILGGFHAQPAAPERRPAAAQHQHFDRENLDLVLDIRMLATARLGHVEMPLGDVLNLGPGSIIEIGHLVDEPIELLINDKLIARGDVVVVDEKFGLRITEIISQKERIENLR